MKLIIVLVLALACFGQNCETSYTGTTTVTDGTDALKYFALCAVDASRRMLAAPSGTCYYYKAMYEGDDDTIAEYACGSTNTVTGATCTTASTADTCTFTDSSDTVTCVLDNPWEASYTGVITLYTTTSVTTDAAMNTYTWTSVSSEDCSEEDDDSSAMTFAFSAITLVSAF